MEATAQMYFRSHLGLCGNQNTKPGHLTFLVFWFSNANNHHFKEGLVQGLCGGLGPEPGPGRSHAYEDYFIDLYLKEHHHLRAFL